jgi:hypothetical protein
MSFLSRRDFFLDKKREKAKLEAELKLQVTLDVVVPAGEAKSGGALTVIGGQYYLNMTDFCNDFNIESEIWTEGVSLPVRVLKGLRAKEFDFYLRNPTMMFLLDATSLHFEIVYYIDLWALTKFIERIYLWNDVTCAKLIFTNLKYRVVFNGEEVDYYRIRDLEYQQIAQIKEEQDENNNEN